MTTVFLHGFATTPAIWLAGGPQLRFDDLEREAERIGNGLAKGTAVIGWSMGGMVAMLIAAKYPGKVSKLVLVSTTPKFIKSADFPFGVPLVLLRRLEKRIARVGTKAFHDLAFKDGHKSGLAQQTIAEVERELRQLERVDLCDQLPQIKCPTLIIHGDQDEICLPAAGEYLHREIKGSRLVIFEGVAHAPMLEAKTEFNKCLREFCDGHA